MDILKIGGKDYKVGVNLILYQKLLKQQKPTEDMSNDKKAEIITENMVNNLWGTLQRRFIFKPFLFKWRMKRKVTPRELLASDKKIGEMISVEDREQGN